MAQTAAHLVDHVIPRVPVRHWVLSLPIPLRVLLAAQPKLVTPVLQVYANIAEFGDGIYGAEAAAQAFFSKPAARLSAAESARLVAVLPSPKCYSAASPGPYVQRRAASIEGVEVGGERGRATPSVWRSWPTVTPPRPAWTRARKAARRWSWASAVR